VLRNGVALPFLTILLVLLSGAARAGEAPLALARGLEVQAELTAGNLVLTPAHSGPRQVKTLGDLENIRARGFDFVRLTVDVDPTAAEEDGLRDTALAQLERGVSTLTDMQLRVLLSLRPSHHLAKDPAAYRQTVASAAQLLARAGVSKTALMLSSEVQDRRCRRMEASDWESALLDLIAAVREAAPDLTLVLSGICDDITGLVRLDPATLGDARLIFNFSFFEPKKFTRQGVGFAQDVKGVPWPADDVATDLAMIFTKLLVSARDLSTSEQVTRIAHASRHIAIYMVGEWSERQIHAQFAKLGAWAETHAIPADRLLLGSFGAVAATDKRGGALAADRFRWLDAVRREADARGVAWVLHSYADADSVAMDALGMSQSAALPQETGSLPVRR